MIFMLNFHNLKPNSGSRKKKMTVGRGNASGHGTYSGRGLKGQKSRTGGRKGLKRLGMKFILAQTPKLGGFKSQVADMNAVNIQELDKLFNDGQTVTPRLIEQKKNFSKKLKGVKILGQGKITKKLEVRAHDFSITARKAIIEAGGKTIVISITKKR